METNCKPRFQVYLLELHNKHCLFPVSHIKLVKKMESRPLYVMMNFKGLEHSTVCILCVGGADDIIIGANLGVRILQVHGRF